MTDQLTRRANLSILLAVFTGAFVMAPFVTPGTVGSRALQVGAVVTLIVAVWSASRSRRLLFVVVGFAVVNELVERLSPSHPGSWLVVLNLLLDFAFVALICAFLGARAWRASRVDAETLVAAVAVYLLLGFFWGTGYSLLEFTEPGSFSSLCPEPPRSNACVPELGHYPRLFYFAFVSITTVGFGDIVPLTGRAEGLTVLAMVSGQLYIVILIGRLVGDYLAHRRDENKE